MDKRIRIPIASFVAILFVCPASPSVAAGIETSVCKVSASTDQVVSLGFPVRSERLSKVADVDILVVPVTPSNAPNVIDQVTFAENYTKAAKYIEDWSNGKTKINFTFTSVLKSNATIEDLDLLKINQQATNNAQDLVKSTWGFVRSTVREIDPITDFSKIDAVMVEASSNSRFEIAEAMMFRPNRGPFFEPIKTDESIINNAVLIYNNRSSITLAHEIMHLYGLTDLYGSSTGPNSLSLMVDNSLRLLNYEKWVLGWLEDSNVTCLEAKNLVKIIEPSGDKVGTSFRDPLDGTPCAVQNEKKPNQIFELVCLPLSQTRPGSTDNSLYWAQNNPPPVASSLPIAPSATSPKFLIENSVKIKNDLNQLIVINAGSGNALIFEITAGKLSDGKLVFYRLNNDGRPPIEVFPYSGVINSNSTSPLSVNNPNSIGARFDSPDLVVLINDINKDEVTLSFIPNSLENSDEAKRLFSDTKSNREQAAIAFKAKQEADAKAKQEADAKAKQEADAKAAQLAALKKNKSLICIKGKLIKKVTALNPTCPKGFKPKK